MAAACDLLEAELAIDRIDAELAVELPPHMRAFAAAYAANQHAPAAPAVLRRASTLRAIEMCRAHPVLADRALAIARLAIPIAIEDDPRVAAARAVAARTWDALATLAAARDTVARERFGSGFFALVHRLFGVDHQLTRDRELARDHELAPDRALAEVAWPAPVDGWLAADGTALDPQAVWAELAARHGARGRVDIIGGDRARTFVVEPGRHAIVVAAPAATTTTEASSPAARFALMHELGHALVALLAPAGVPRVVDEAAAAYIARGIEATEPLAARARQRRLQLAMALDAIERGGIERGGIERGGIERGGIEPGGTGGSERRVSTTGGARPTERPPWALWHDPGAQAAYVEAEAIAERWWDELGPSPAPGALGHAIARERARIDAATTL